MYHPYCHSPSALTEYLKQRLRLQRAKRLGRSLPAQVELNVQPKRNKVRYWYNLSTAMLRYKESVVLLTK